VVELRFEPSGLNDGARIAGFVDQRSTCVKNPVQMTWITPIRQGDEFYRYANWRLASKRTRPVGSPAYDTRANDGGEDKSKQVREISFETQPPLMPPRAPIVQKKSAWLTSQRSRQGGIEPQGLIRHWDEMMRGSAESQTKTTLSAYLGNNLK